MQNGVSSNVYEGQIQVKKRQEVCGRKEERKKNMRRKETKNEEEENDERFSRSGWKWSLSF